MTEPSIIPIDPIEKDRERDLFRLPARVEESRLLEILRNELNFDANQRFRIASVSTGRGQAAEWLARNVQADVSLWYLDSYQASRASEHVAIPQVDSNEAVANEPSTSQPLERPTNLTIDCAADLAEGPYDFATISMVTNGEAELARDILQQMYHQLAIGGRLIASVDNPDDRWLHDQLKLFDKRVKVRNFDDAVVYIVDKQTPLKKLKDFSCELAYRDCDELVQLVTRPGVFSHRQLDNGARQLLDAVDVFPDSKMIDIGCGSGSVALGLAKRDPSAHVHAVDSNARSIWCVQRGIELNQLTNITTEVNCTGVYGEPGHFDMALANPPYFGDFRIAEKFIAAAHRSLRKGGRFVLVTKQPKWYQENLDRWFIDCEVFASRRYFIASGVKS